MRNKLKFLSGLLLTLLVFYSCDDILNVDSEALLLEEKHKINNEFDANYAVTGIYSLLEKLGERYVLLGELRGDMMELTLNAREDIKEISEFNISPDNPYVNIRDYYAVINQCNYVINKLDTTAVVKAEKILYRDMGLVKAIRAWTYLQMVLNYRTVKYYEDALLDVKLAEASFPEYSLEELIPVLINDLEPFKNVELPDAVGIDGATPINSDELTFPVRFVLGDLYLWNGEYERAALEYRNLMIDRSLILFTPSNTWNVDNAVFLNIEIYWSMLFNITSRNYERITCLARSREYGQDAFMDSLMLHNYEVRPTNEALRMFLTQTYYHNSNVTNVGDLRVYNTIMFPDIDLSIEGEELEANVYPNVSGNAIRKYLMGVSETASVIYLYRVAQLHLRYAEAVNRAGKPNLAFSVLKHGLKESVIMTDSIVPPRERPEALPSYMDFSDPYFENSLGVRERGGGNVSRVPAFRIPSLPTLQDSIEYVEDKIIEELALEMAYEGHRFHDLMRVALRRNDPVYLAKTVAKRNYQLESILLDKNNWYLPQ